MNDKTTPVKNQAKELLASGEMTALAELVNNLDGSGDLNAAARDQQRVLRESIDVQKNLKTLQRVADGTLTISAMRFKAVELLLRKGLADLKSFDVQGSIEHRQESIFAFTVNLTGAKGGELYSLKPPIEHEPTPEFLTPPEDRG